MSYYQCFVPHKGNKIAEKYTLEIAEELFIKIMDLLDAEKEICTHAELMVRAIKTLNIPSRVYRYLLLEKFKNELEIVKEEIDLTIESRIVKQKDTMHAGIVAMVLKNKHGYTDEHTLKTPDLIPEEAREDRLNRIRQYVSSN